MPASRSPADAGIGRDDWQLVFLVELRATGNVSAAARVAETCRSRCYEARRRDPDFAAAWAAFSSDMRGGAPFSTMTRSES